MTDRLRLLGRVTSGVVHDLSNYLGVIDLTLTVLEQRHRKGASGDTLATAREATQRALRLTGCLLEYARGGTPAPELVDLPDAVTRVLELFGRVLPARVTVQVDVEGAPPPIVGVAAEVEQLVLNLLLNASEAMPDGGAVKLAVRASQATVSLEVTDTGIGLPAPVASADAAVSPSTKTGRPGGGLGLGIVRCVAARHAALLTIGPRPDGGTSVLVEFPTDGAGPREQLGQGLSHGCQEILIVDDDHDTRELLRDLLSWKGFAVHTAENGRVALDWLEGRRSPPACIILDLEMPVMDGWEFMNRLREKPAVPPVVVLSGAANPPAGAILYFAKPPPVGALLQAVTNCCNSR